MHEISRELRAFGAGIFTWENGLRALKALTPMMKSDGAHEAITYETRQDDKLITAYSFTADQGTSMLTMTRQHLYAAIIHAAEREGVEIRRVPK